MKEDLNSYQRAYTPEFAYHWDEGLLLRAYMGKLIEYLRDIDPLRLLSLGIGGQLVSQSLWQAFPECAYDIVEGSADILERYRREMDPPSSVRLHHGWFEEIDFGHAIFDAIEMGFVLEHVDDPGLVLRRYLRQLRPGGLVFVAVPNGRSLHRLLGHAAGLMNDIYALSPSDLALGHKRYFDASSIEKLVAASGYTPVAQYGLVIKPLTTGQLLSLKPTPDLERAFIEVGYGLPAICNGTLIVARRN